MKLTGSSVKALSLARVRRPASTAKPATVLRREEKACQRKRGFFLLLGFEHGAEDPGQVADVLGDEKIMLHEALDAARAGMGRVAHAAADLALDVEGHALLGAAGQVVQMTAH